MNDDQRQELHAWLAEIGQPASRLVPLAGDVSRRVYARVHHAAGSTSILALYPPEMIDVCRRFGCTTELLTDVGVRVPRILARDCAGGRMLLEDAGRHTLYDQRSRGWRHLSRWIARAEEVAAHIAKLPPAPVADLNPPLDGELFARELRQTWDLLLVPRGLAGDGAARDRLRSALAEVCRRLDDEPRRVCHRDFMARNLVPVDVDLLLVLDHQDLRLGPAAYDLASLLNDSLFCPIDLEERLVETHLAGEPDSLFSSDRRESYRRCVVQRALKACGTYAAFAASGSRRHLRLVAPTLCRAADNLARIPEGTGLEALLERWRSLQKSSPSG